MFAINFNGGSLFILAKNDPITKKHTKQLFVVDVYAV